VSPPSPRTEPGNLRHRARLQVDAALTVLGKGVGFV